jgi:hypothetical protein
VQGRNVGPGPAVRMRAIGVVGPETNSSHAGL